MVFEACGAALNDASVGFSAKSRCAGRWVLPCALLGLRPSPVRGPRGHHRGVASRWRTTLRRHSMTVSHDAGAPCGTSAPSPSKRPRNRRIPRGVIRWEPKLLSGHRDPASPGVRDLSAPPPTHPARVHIPSPRVAPGRLRADGTTRPAMFRPRGFAPPRRFSPRVGLRACCIPLPVLGFAAFH